ncbi:hypothetical protein AB0K49_33475, partial [Streptomyces decoyicus]|uniref:hypothetical protein n=1 Tax=Streptomyces decoyicus TaxID=249567 RepID=UPI00345D0172
LALTFGTLLSSQGTDASFVPVSPGSPGASLRCFTLYQAFFVFRTAAFLQACRCAQFLSRDQDAGSAAHLNRTQLIASLLSGAGLRQYSSGVGEANRFS